MALPSGVHLLVGSQDLTDAYGTDVKGLSVTDVTPGGFESATYEVRNALYVPKIDAPVAVYDENYRKHAFLGVVSGMREKADCMTIECGRTTRDDKFVPSPPPLKITQTYPPATRISAIIRDAFQLMPDVYDDSRIIDPDIQLVQETQNFAGNTGEDLLNFITSVTTQLSTPVLWWVWDAAHGGHLSVLVVQFQDTGARYRVTITKNEIERVYSRNSYINSATVQWGNDQYATSPNEAGGESLDHTILRQRRMKYVNASRNIGTRGEALALAQNYLARFSQYRSTSGTITLTCNTHAVRAMYPVVDAADDNYPLHLVRSGNAIDVHGAGPAQGHFIVKKTYAFDPGHLSLEYGEVINLESTVDLMHSYAIHRLYNAIFLPGASYPLADADVAPVYGPQFDGSSPPSFSAGLPIFVLDDTGALKYKAVIHPDLQADEGIEANITVGDIQTVGLKPGVRIIPGEFNNLEVVLGNDDGLLVGADNVKLTFLKLADDGVNLVPLFAAVTVPGPRLEVPIRPVFTMGRKEWIFPRIETAAATATWASISFHGKKLHPGLRV